MAKTAAAPRRKRKSGIPTGNAGEYFVMGELLRRGYDAQLADRNTKGYDILVGRPDDETMEKVQVKTVRSPPWYVQVTSFEGDRRSQVTIYVLLGTEEAKKPVRYFIAKNGDLTKYVHRPHGWPLNGFVGIRALQDFENHWHVILDERSARQGGRDRP